MRKRIVTGLRLLNEGWTREAACRGMDPNIFFLTTGDSYPEIAYAKSICNSCPVIDNCLEFGLKYHTSNNDYAHGIWGGLTLRERRRLLKERKHSARRYS